jgi:hypothetical protein
MKPVIESEERSLIVEEIYLLRDDRYGSANIRVNKIQKSPGALGLRKVKGLT